MTKVDFGASLIYEQRFTSKSRDSAEANSRARCVEGSASACAKAEGWGVKGSGCLNSTRESCGNASFDNNWGGSTGLESTRQLSIGSGLAGHDTWGTNDNFKPVPIR